MTLLCVDVTNSTTVLGLFRGDTLVGRWRLRTVPERTADEWATLVEGAMTRGGHHETVAGVCLSSTVPAVLHELQQMLGAYAPDAEPVVMGPGVKTGIKVRTDHPREVGTDRIAGAVAAVERWPGTRIIVGFGTATTFDVVNPAGEYVGGAIGPGLGLSMDALGRRAAQLHQVELRVPRAAVGRNTVEALQSGIAFGTAAMVDGMVTRIVDEIGADRAETTVVATGPLAYVVVEQCSVVDQVEPWLTLHGLRLVHRRTRG